MTFKMPCLSRYNFHTSGQVQQTRDYAFVPLRMQYTNSPNYYELTNDEGVSERVTIAEIIQYGKHVSFLTEMTTLRGTSKYIDLINAFNYSKNKFAQ